MENKTLSSRLIMNLEQQQRVVWIFSSFSSPRPRSFKKNLHQCRWKTSWKQTERTPDASSGGGGLKRHKVTAPAWPDYTNKSLLVSDGRAASWPSPWGPEDGTDDRCGHRESGTKQSQGSIRSVKQASFKPCVRLKSQWMEVEGVCVGGRRGGFVRLCIA